MKCLRFLLIFFGLSMIVFQTHAQTNVRTVNDQVLISPSPISITLPMVGKAGATISSSGKVKICPGWAWNKCATITISFLETQSIVTHDNFPVEVALYDDDERVIDTLFLTGEIISSGRLSSIESLNELTEDDIIFK